MIIKTIMCNASREFYEQNAQARLDLALDGVELRVVNLEHGPDSLESAYDAAIAAPFIMSQVESAEKEGCDAVVIDCAADPVLRAAREISDLPVVSAGEASHHVAMQVSSKFSIITVLSTSANEIEENVIKGGYASRLASIRSADTSVLGLCDGEASYNKIHQAALCAIEEDGASAIVLGCTGMLKLREALQEQLGVPVIEPFTAAIEAAATLVRMNLKQSRISYIKAGNKEYY